MADEVVIRTEGLTKTYSSLFGRVKVHALDNLNLEVRRGEVFGLIGPNGSGKTTTIKLLLGLLFPTSGRAEILGRAPTHVETKHRIGFLPEESYLYGFLNADETLDFFGRIFDLPGAERARRIHSLLEQFEIAHARKRPIREYSKGMMRRVMFCQALINDPDVIILDEPTSGLDPISSRKIKDLILELKKQGKTVLLSSHLLADMQDVCDRVAILYQGVLRKVGMVRDLLVNKDLVTLVLGDAGPGVLKKVRDLLSREGAHVVSCDNTQENLESVFLKTIRESQAPKAGDGGGKSVPR
ncbi:MAG TPA: ABC transporter ATP-binding protein [Planctomycetota bacterium]|nr:ABC transporter ATP-binding protein [Planctomycetota bacterium]